MTDECGMTERWATADEHSPDHDSHQTTSSRHLASSTQLRVLQQQNSIPTEHNHINILPVWSTKQLNWFNTAPSHPAQLLNTFYYTNDYYYDRFGMHATAIIILSICQSVPLSQWWSMPENFYMLKYNTLYTTWQSGVSSFLRPHFAVQSSRVHPTRGSYVQAAPLRATVWSICHDNSLTVQDRIQVSITH